MGYSIAEKGGLGKRSKVVNNRPTCRKKRISPNLKALTYSPNIPLAVAGTAGML